MTAKEKQRKANAIMTSEYPELLKAARKVSSQCSYDLSDELLHYCIDQLYMKKNHNDIILNPGFRYYMVRMLMNNIQSNTSPFYFIYRKNYNHELNTNQGKVVDEDDNYPISDVVMKELAKMEWFDSQLWNVFINKGVNITQLAKDIGIPRNTINISLQNTKKQLKKAVKAIYTNN